MSHTVVPLDIVLSALYIFDHSRIGPRKQENYSSEAFVVFRSLQLPLLMESN